jgi:alpha-N-arabinofuranosidase
MPDGTLSSVEKTVCSNRFSGFLAIPIEGLDARMTKRTMLYEHIPTGEGQGPASEGHGASLWIDDTVRSTYRVSPRLLGKFCEHLGSNIYNGMEAQILFNPTFGQWSFIAHGLGAGASRPDGGVAIESEKARIAQQSAHYVEQFGLHDLSLLMRDLDDGCAFGWVRLGGVEDVRASPDVGPHGDRAQRFEVLGETTALPLGLAQRTYLPVHRTRGFEYRLVGRAYQPVTLTVTLSAVVAGQAGPALASVDVQLDGEWRTLAGALDIPPQADIDPLATFEVRLLAAQGANIVLDRVLLYPDDHVGYADPDVIRMLRESGLPLLRWPGGNFVSGYHWRDGIGPVDARPTRPNPAWPGLEYNTFGTDEFIAFCRQVGCESMICVNAGFGAPEEAAAWLEYCNGGPDTPMGALRAENGHPEPYDVRIWEIGNEVHGDWQAGWTTAGGYVDRYRRFVAAMRAVDPEIEIVACGDQLMGLASEWNRRLIDEGADDLRSISDHLLTGHLVHATTDPAELYHAFMGFAGTLDDLYAPMLERMSARGIKDPRIAITELQLFAHFSGQPRPGRALRPEWLPTPATISEALYLMTYIHAFVRMQGAVEMLTHSATVNHGGGLRKTRERVWANPVHYAHQMAHPLVGGTPLKVRVACDVYSTTHSFGHIPAHPEVPILDALAVLGGDGRQLIVTLVNRSGRGEAVDLRVVPGTLAVGPEAELVCLSGETMYDQNTLQESQRIVPRCERVPVSEDGVRLSVSPFTLARLVFDLVPA